ncbi:MAG TPA: response regulator [Spirochaetota bacterium]|nr:response regulator [Spirochaetota bacterium]HOL56181.1 response regulator [Spirochaetota bacterium]HPP03785.1 response regulator [Spirochaetota bacterium]
MEDIIDFIRIGVAIIKKDFKIIKISKEFEKITEWQESDFKEKSLEIINESFLEKIYLNIKNKDFSPIEDEITIITKSKKEKEIKRYVNYVIENNEITKIVITIIDISNYKKRELNILSSQRLETLSTVTKAISLEYNNLLATIVGFASFLKGIINPGTEIYNYLNIIEKNANRASALTNQLLSFAGTDYFRESQININNIISYNVELFQKTLMPDISFNLNLTPEDIIIYWDENQIHQIIINLILNAKEAIEEKKNPNGKINIISKIENGYFKLYIEDNGIGIKDNQLEKIFEPYYTTKDIKKHSGLGLSVTQGIIKNMNGTIDVKIEKRDDENWTIFIISIPYKLKEIETYILPEIDGKNTKVLVIDDVPEIRNLSNVILKQKNFNPILAGSAKEAMEILNKERDIELILLDVVMPEMSGEHLFKEIKNRYPNIPIILLTGCTEERILSGLLKQESVEIILKPFNTFDFITKIAKVIKK